MNILGKFPLVRLKQIRDNPSFVFYYLKRVLYYKYISDRYLKLYKDLIFLSPEDTLEYLISKRASIARFGDGDIEQLTGAGEYPPDSDWSQKASKRLISRLEEVLDSDMPELLIAPISPSIFLCPREDAERSGIVFNMWTDARMLLHRYLKRGRIYGDANVFVPFHHPKLDWSKLYEFLQKRDVVIVTGGTSKLYGVSLGRRMFFVETGKHNAFERYASIRASLMRLIDNEGLKNESTLIMVSLGPTADILALDLTKEGWQVWDTGHFFKFTDRKFLELGKGHAVFTKQLEIDSVEETERIFRKSIRLHEASQNVGGLIIAKPLEHTNTTIRYEHLNLPDHLSELLRRSQWDADWFARVGRALGGLHKELLGQNENGLVHGDFWSHNIAIGEKEVFFFDTEPPGIHKSLDEHMENSRYMDLAGLLVSMSLSSGFKQVWRLMSSKQVYARAFLAGYEASSGFILDCRKMRDHIDIELRRWQEWNLSYGHNRWIVQIKYQIASIVIMWQVSVCKILER